MNEALADEGPADERDRRDDWAAAIEQEAERIRGNPTELMAAVSDYDEFVDISAPFRAWVVAVAVGDDVGKRRAEQEMEYIVHDAVRRQAAYNVQRRERL